MLREYNKNMIYLRYTGDGKLNEYEKNNLTSNILRTIFPLLRPSENITFRSILHNQLSA